MIINMHDIIQVLVMGSIECVFFQIKVFNNQKGAIASLSKGAPDLCIFGLNLFCLTYRDKYKTGVTLLLHQCELHQCCIVSIIYTLELRSFQ